MLDRVRNILFPLGLIFIALNGLGPLANVSGYLALFASIALTMQKKGLQYGKWYVWVLIGVIVLLCIVRNTGAVSAYFAVIIPLVYFAALNADKKTVSNAFGSASLVASLSIMVLFALGRNTGGGGIVDSTNYNLATGFIIIGALLGPNNWRWALITLAVPSLLMAGSEEAIFGIGVICVVSLLRQDYGKRMIVLVSIGALCLVSLFAFKQPATMYSRIFPQIDQPSSFSLTNGRDESFQQSITDIRLFGHGYDPRTMSYNTIHSVPLLVLYQIGPFGFLAFLGLLVITFKRTKSKYLMAGLCALMVWDHYFFTQLFTWTFATIGLSQVSEESDYIWRENHVEVKEIEPATV